MGNIFYALQVQPQLKQANLLQGKRAEQKLLWRLAAFGDVGMEKEAKLEPPQAQKRLLDHHNLKGYQHHALSTV